MSSVRPVCSCPPCLPFGTTVSIATPMVALGCLLLVVLPLLGFMGGAFLAGPEGAWWGAGAGFVLALASCGFAGYALVQASRRR